MIGKAYISLLPYYDRTSHQMRFKKRPILIIGQSDASDFVILPISRVTNAANIDLEYDIKITPETVPLMNLKQTSYIRTHKQLVIHFGEITKEIVDFKKEYPDIYLEVLAKMEQFQNSIIDNAL